MLLATTSAFATSLVPGHTAKAPPKVRLTEDSITHVGTGHWNKSMHRGGGHTVRLFPELIRRGFSIVVEPGTTIPAELRQYFEARGGGGKPARAAPRADGLWIVAMPGASQPQIEAHEKQARRWSRRTGQLARYWKKILGFAPGPNEGFGKLRYNTLFPLEVGLRVDLTRWLELNVAQLTEQQPPQEEKIAGGRVRYKWEGLFGRHLGAGGEPHVSGSPIRARVVAEQDGQVVTAHPLQDGPLAPEDLLRQVANNLAELALLGCRDPVVATLTRQARQNLTNRALSLLIWDLAQVGSDSRQLPALLSPKNPLVKLAIRARDASSSAPVDDLDRHLEIEHRIRSMLDAWAVSSAAGDFLEDMSPDVKEAHAAHLHATEATTIFGLGKPIR